MDFQEDFILNLKFYRKEKSVSQEKLAEMCECATSTIGCIECGRQTPSFDLIVKIEVRAITQKANIRAIATLSFSFFLCA